MPIKKAKYNVGDNVMFEDNDGEVIERSWVKSSESWNGEGYWSYEVVVSSPTYHTVTEDEMYE